MSAVFAEGLRWGAGFRQKATEHGCHQRWKCAPYGKRPYGKWLAEFRNRSATFQDDRNWPALVIDPMRIQVDAQMAKRWHCKILRSDRAGFDGSAASIR